MGDKEFVEEKFDELKVIVWRLLKNKTQEEAHVQDKNKDPEIPSGKDETISIPQLQTEKSTDQALATIYYYQNVQKKKPALISDLKKLNEERSSTPTKNFSVALQNNLRKGFIEKTKDKPFHYTITDKGTKYILNGFKK